MATITKHGTAYFEKNKEKCPECGDKVFRVAQMTGDARTPCAGIYELTCSKCGCVWITEERR
jgi:hypothetical protein